MRSDTQTASRPLAGQMAAKLQALMPFVASLVCALPAIAVTVLLMETRAAWPHSQFFILAILGLMILDFVTLFIIEPYRGSLGALTIPAMLAFIGMTILFLMTEALNRVFVSSGFGWLTPMAVAALAVIYGGVFRERSLPLKLFLCLNGLALAVLWCLGDAGKMALPF